MANRSDGSIIIDTGLDNSGYEKGSEKLLKAIESLTREVEKLNKALAGTADAIGNKIKDSAKAVEQLESSIGEAEDQASNLEDSASKVSDALDQASGSDSIPVDEIKGAADAMGDLGTGAAEAEAGAGAAAEAAGDLGGALGGTGASAEAAGGALAALGGPEVVAAIVAITVAVKAAEAVISTFKKKWQELTGPFKEGKKQFEELSTSTEESRRKFGFYATAILHPKKSMEKLSYAADQMRDKLLKAIGTSILNSFKRLGTAAKDSAKNLVKVSAGKVVSGIKNAASAVGSLAKNMAAAAGNAIRSGVTGLVGKIKDIGKSALSSGFGLKSLISNLTGLSGVSSLFAKAVSMAKEGMAGLAQKNAQFNKTMSAFVTACNQLKGALASAFAPIANVALPMLTKLINFVIKAVNAIGMLVAALTGQKSFSQAVAVQADYAKESSKATKSTKKQKKAQEELNRTIASFDDLNILNSNKKSDDDDDDATGFDPADYGFDFKEVPIESSISDLAERIKEAWESGDFFDLGRDLGEKIKEALEKIPWKKIQDLARKAGKSVATFLNGLMSVPGLARTIGETVAEAINTIFHALDGFGENFSWSLLGQFIREGLLGLLQNIDWKLIYKTAREYGAGIGRAIEAAFDDPEIWSEIFEACARGLNSVIYFIVGFLEAIDWGSLFHNIAQGLNDGIEEIDWATLAQMLVDMFQALFDAAYEFVTTFDFKKFGEHLGQTLNTVIEEVDWSRAFRAMGALVTGLFASLLGFLKEVDWANVGSTLAESINDGIKETDWSLIGETIKELFNAVVDVFFEFVKNFDFAEFGKDLADLINGAITGLKIEEFFEAIATLINGLFTLMLNFLQEIDWAQFATDIAESLNAAIQEYDVDTMTDAVSTFINSLIDLFLNFVTTFDWMTFGLSIGQSIGDTLEKVNWEDFATSLGEFINGLFESFKGLAAAIDWNELVQNIVDFIITFLQSVDWEGNAEAISMFITGLLTALQNLVNSEDWDKVVQLITDAFNEFFKNFDWYTMVKAAVDLFKEWWKLKDHFPSFMDILKIAGKDIVAGIFGGITDKLKSVGSWIKDNVFTPILTAIKSVFGINSPAETMKPIGKYLISGLFQGIKDKISGIKEWFSQHLKGPFIDKLRSIFGIKQSSSEMAKQGEELTDDLKDGMSKGQKKVDSTFKSSLKNLVSIVKNTDWKSSGQAITDKIKNGLNFSKIESAARNGAKSTQHAFQNAVSWGNIGANIASGIADGLSRNSGWISNVAYNAAIDAYNAACDALGIASPSKKFIWIAKMMLEGMANGIVKNKDTALDAVSALAAQVVSAAESESPFMEIQTQGAIDGLESVLDAFSDRIVDGFTEMINSLAAIVNGGGFIVPGIAAGTVAPYALTSASGASSIEGGNSEILDALDRIDRNTIKRDELRPMLEEIAKKYQPYFYIGDEDIARHNNHGQLLLQSISG